MRAPRLLGLTAVLPLLAAGLMPATTAVADTAETAAPVQLLELTTSTGEATEVAEAGLEETTSAGTSGGTAVAPRLNARLATVARAVTAGGVDPEADALLLTEPLEVDDFLVAGFTWTGADELPDGLDVYLRVRENGVWSEWYLNEASGAGRDDAVGVAGTEEFVTGGADAVQASVVGDAADLPAGLRLALIPGEPVGEEVLEPENLGSVDAEPTAVATPEEAEDNLTSGLTTPTGVATQEADEATSQTGGAEPEAAEATAATTESAAASTGTSGGTSVSPNLPAALAATTTAGSLPVPVITRAEWGANSSYMTWTPSYVAADHVIVHHTAGTNNYTSSQSASIVNGIYYYHAVTLGWGDIGYNFLVDKYGQVFEGRYGSTGAAAGKMVVGGHAYGANTGTMGISMMGTYTSVSPSSTHLTNVGKMAGWFLKRAGVTSATGSSAFTFKSTEKYAAGQTISLPVISGHRDVGYTTCPGDVGYSKLGQIRSTAQSQINSSSNNATSSTSKSTSSNGARSHQIYLNDAWSATANTVFTYTTPATTVLAGDWNGDGKDTTGVRNGAAYGFRNANTSGASLRTFTYGKSTDQVLVGDWDGNGTDTLAVRRGNTYYFRNSMYGGGADKVVVYGKAADEVIVGDWNGDGKDTLAVRRGGQYHIKNSLTGGKADQVVIYGKPTDTVLVGDWNGNGKDTLAVRRNATYYVRNSLSSGVADIVQIYGRAGDKTIVGDWNGDKKDTLGVVR
ncbi:N-acetylmuramoyl-L-alanine amidase [Actinomyces succiniciruminis]|uniref:Animal peptidoglycan recognition proteins homologous to Bacteriophage T3 lysozyme n=1 Tax=Actinomyces succiniciruminis TaxID=1522002 RepID=A0A1L7RI08_9ACTO|nr:N-acetylmuramoyl-L-alanine amidase [Actinomyces succiniciruminis]CED91356.1 Animal peptidoglycan recognition proteins homologous to Bacteriophage T3 lysozyme [Actinomyces succiniciruminis]